MVSEVEVLEREDGDAEGEETGKSEWSEEGALRKVEMCCDEGCDDDEEGERLEELQIAG